MKVFLLDDIRDEVAAYQSAGIPISNLMNDTVTVARTFDDGVKVIQSRDVFDLWILDHDIACYTPDNKEQSGYDFLMYAIYTMPEKIPAKLISCSANPVGRKRINDLFTNWKNFNN